MKEAPMAVPPAPRASTVTGSRELLDWESVSYLLTNIEDVLHDVEQTFRLHPSLSL